MPNKNSKTGTFKDMPNTKHIVLAIILSNILAASLFPVRGQTLLVNNSDGNIIAVDISDCSSTAILNIGSYTDITFHPDGNYYGIKSNGQIFRINPSSGGGTEVSSLSGGGFFTSLTADGAGLVYAADLDGNLYTYNPATDTNSYIGDIGVGASGDLTFYNGDLYVASTANTLVKIDADDLSNNSVFINFASTGAEIFGIVSYVEGCDARTFATSSDNSARVYEINWTDASFDFVCTLPHRVYGGASEFEFNASTNPIVVGDVVVNFPGCGTATTGNVNIEASSTNGGLTYSLDGITFQSSDQFNDLPPGIYTVYLMDAIGCTKQYDFLVEPDEGITIGNATAMPSTCNLDNGSISVIADSPAGGNNYSLDGINFQSNGIFENLPGGTYTVFIEDLAGCTTSTQLGVEVEAPFIVEGIEVTPTSCGENNGTISAMINSLGNDISYTLNGGTPSNSNQFEGMAPGAYELFIQDQNGCEETFSLEIDDSSPIELIEINSIAGNCGETAAEINVEAVGDGGIFYSLEDGPTNGSGIFTNLENGNYSLKISYADGTCPIGPFEVLIADPCTIFIPNTFSPNGDRKNDVFRLYSPADFDVVTFEIYDRWGELLFEDGGYPIDEFNQGWDGSFKGKPMPIGVYVYHIIIMENGTETTYTGDINLLR